MKTKFSFISIVFILIAGPGHTQVSGASVETSFQNYIRSSSGSVNTGSVLPNFLIKQDTKGNRYLYENWVEGSVTGVNGVVYNPPKYRYNYDKINRKLFMLLDTTTIVELSSEDIAGFSLKTNGQVMVFERLKNSTDLNFYQEIGRAHV